MVKLLVCGDINSKFEILTKRLNALQSSNHGPFDLLICIGTFFQNKEELESICPNLELPIETLIQDSNNIINDTNTKLLPSNLNVLKNNHGCIVEKKLNIAYLDVLSSNNNNNSSYLDEFNDMTSKSYYRGCDILLTTDWPQNMHHFLENEEYNKLKSLGVGIGTGNKDVTSLAVLLKPRYHFVIGRNCFYQRSPYRNSNDKNYPCTRIVALSQVNDIPKDKTRKWLHALSLEPMSSMSHVDLVQESNGTTDCPYADIGPDTHNSIDIPTGISNIISNNNKRCINNMSYTTVGHMNGNVAPGAFFFGQQNKRMKTTSLVAPSTNATTVYIGNVPNEASELEVRSLFPNAINVRKNEGKPFAFVSFRTYDIARSLVDTANAPSDAPIYSIRGRTLAIGWAEHQSKSNTHTNVNTSTTTSLIPGTAIQPPPPPPPLQLEPSNTEAKTLFVRNLPKHVDWTDEELQEVCIGAVSVKRIVGKLHTFAFVEFSCHENAKQFAEKFINCEHNCILHGNQLEFGWGTEIESNNTNSNTKTSTTHKKISKESTQKSLISTPPSNDCRYLFVVPAPSHISIDDISSCMQAITTRRPKGRSYCFVEFDSNESALQVLNNITNDDNHDLKQLLGETMKVGWAKGEPLGTSMQSSHTQPCWFCLSSDNVRSDLVVSVAEQIYIAIPRGSMHKLHSLIIPIECVPSRIHLSTDAKNELLAYITSIQNLYEAHGYATLIFERALRTKGKDHMQTHCIPIEANVLNNSMNVFLNCIKEYNLHFKEIQQGGEMEGMEVDDIVVNMEGGPYQEYFYIRIPISISYSSSDHSNSNNNNKSNQRYREFVYVPQEHVQNDDNNDDNNDDDENVQITENPENKSTSKSKVQFPMLLGLEIAAKIMGCPQKAYWKNNIVDKEAEEQMAAEFREEFTKFDHTLSEE